MLGMLSACTSLRKPFLVLLGQDMEDLLFQMKKKKYRQE